MKASRENKPIDVWEPPMQIDYNGGTREMRIVNRMEVRL